MHAVGFHFLVYCTVRAVQIVCASAVTVTADFRRGAGGRQLAGDRLGGKND